MQKLECQIGFEPTKYNFADCTPNHLATGTGADIRTWTEDLMITNQLLYQLSYTGI